MLFFKALAGSGVNNALGNGFRGQCSEWTPAELPLPIRCLPLIVMSHEMKNLYDIYNMNRRHGDSDEMKLS